MDTTAATSPLNFDIRSPRASYVVIQTVPPKLTDDYLHWQRSITAAAAPFPGYQQTEAYPPVDPYAEKPEWVIVIHFDTPQALERWLTSSERAHWMAKLPQEFQKYQIKSFPSGLGSYFRLFVDPPPGPLPHLKAIFAVMLGLYPTIMLMTWFITPKLNHLGLGISMLIGNILSVTFLEYVIMPGVSYLLRPWLQANAPQDRTTSIAGYALIVAALAFMVWFFHLFAHHFQQ
jgi:uncharacterized protein